MNLSVEPGAITNERFGRCGPELTDHTWQPRMWWLIVTVVVPRAGAAEASASAARAARASGARRIVRLRIIVFSNVRVDSVSAERAARTSESQLKRCAGFPQTDRASLGCRFGPQNPCFVHAQDQLCSLVERRRRPPPRGQARGGPTACAVLR